MSDEFTAGLGNMFAKQFAARIEVATRNSVEDFSTLALRFFQIINDVELLVKVALDVVVERPYRRQEPGT